MTMGERSKLLREKNGLTMEQLGEIIGVQKSAIRKYEKGSVTNIKRSTIKTMSDFFRVSPTYIMFGEEDEKSLIPITKEEAEHKKVIEIYLALSSENQLKLLDYAKLLLTSEKVERDSRE